MGYSLFLLFVLIFIILSFTGVFGRFPDSWAWIGIIFAGLGIVMTAPTIFQMVWGGPTLKTQFDITNNNNLRSLIIFLSNPPVKKILRIFGVRRETIQSLTADYRILEAGSKKVVAAIRHARFFEEDLPSKQGKERITLPPTFSVTAVINIIIWDIRNNNAQIMPDVLRPLTPIAPGEYVFQIIFFIDGIQHEMVRKFIVGNKPEELTWVKPN